MPTEQLILRRVFPVPVTFADLRRAAGLMPYSRVSLQERLQASAPFARLAVSSLLNDLQAKWHAAIKESTGALDEVYAVIDGREVRVATVDKTGNNIMFRAGTNIDRALGGLLIAADEAGYWQRPHEVRHVLEESQMSHRTMARIAGNSFIVAGSK